MLPKVTRGLKAKRLLKIRKNPNYIRCKESYKTLNERGREVYPSFKEYASWYKYQNTLHGDFSKCKGNLYGWDTISYSARIMWHSYHSKDKI